MELITPWSNKEFRNKEGQRMEAEEEKLIAAVFFVLFCFFITSTQVVLVVYMFYIFVWCASDIHEFGFFLISFELRLLILSVPCTLLHFYTVINILFIYMGSLVKIDTMNCCFIINAFHVICKLYYI